MISERQLRSIIRRSILLEAKGTKANIKQLQKLLGEKETGGWKDVKGPFIKFANKFRAWAKKQPGLEEKMGEYEDLLTKILENKWEDNIVKWLKTTENAIKVMKKSKQTKQPAAKTGLTKKKKIIALQKLLKTKRRRGRWRSDRIDSYWMKWIQDNRAKIWGKDTNPLSRRELRRNMKWPRFNKEYLVAGKYTSDLDGMLGFVQSISGGKKEKTTKPHPNDKKKEGGQKKGKQGYSVGVGFAGGPWTQEQKDAIKDAVKSLGSKIKSRGLVIIEKKGKVMSRDMGLSSAKITTEPANTNKEFSSLIIDGPDLKDVKLPGKGWKVVIKIT